jgi:CBS-domain-containing membrane protein
VAKGRDGDSDASKADRPKATAGRQVNFRASDELYSRLERISGVLGVDLSNLVRLILHENLPAYERRAAQLEAESKD